MLSIILMFIGFLIINREELHINFLDIHATGSPIRVAGRLLMMPFFGSIILGLGVGIVTNGDLNALFNLLQGLVIVELIVVLICVTLAYLILRQNQVPDYLSFFGGNSPLAPRSPASLHPNTSRDFPSVMTTQQAAQYLNVPEKRIIDAIYQGELAASHMNNRYVISRSVLDEFRTRL
jgi:excisionase family DNA binding protein